MVFRALQTATRDFLLDVVPTPLAFGFLSGLQHNWANSYSLSTSFSTQISRGYVDSDEDRRSLMLRPRRSSNSSHLALAASEVWRFNTKMADRMRDSNTPIPIYSDVATITNVSGDILTVDSLDFKRFFVGQYLMILAPDRSIFPSGTNTVSAVYVQLSVIGANTLTHLGSGSVVIQEGWCVFPCFQSVPASETSQEAQMESAALGEWGMQAVEAVDGSSMLPPVQQSEDVSSLGFEYYSDVQYGNLPILKAAHNWGETADYTWTRPSSFATSGRASVSTMLTTNADALETSRDLKLSREDYWTLMRFFESRLGRVRPFWFVGNVDFWSTATWVGAPSTVQLPDIGLFNLITAHVDGLYFNRRDGSSFFRKLLSVAAPSGGEVTATLETAMPAGGSAANPICSVRPASVSRFFKDVITEEWVTTDFVRTTLEIQGIRRTDDVVFP